MKVLLTVNHQTFEIDGVFMEKERFFFFVFLFSNWVIIRLKLVGYEKKYQSLK